MNMAYQKDLDAVLLMYSVLSRLGCGDVETFPQRLKSQKVQYLAQTFGISPSYEFNLYIRGPYSPALADDLFKLRAEKVNPKGDKFIPTELEDRLRIASKFIEGKTLRQLELVTTMHWLRAVAGYSNDDSGVRLKSIKKADDTEVKVTEAFTEELCQLSGK
jgi:uncharacterized protein YwgA